MVKRLYPHMYLSKQDTTDLRSYVTCNILPIFACIQIKCIFFLKKKAYTEKQKNEHSSSDAQITALSWLYLRRLSFLHF